VSGDYRAIEENLRAAMRFFGEASGAGEVRPFAGCIAMYSGLDYGVFNIGLLTEPIEGAGRELEWRLKQMGRFFLDRTPRWSFWLCEEMLSPEARQNAIRIFSDFGLRAISHPPGMMAASLLPPVRPLPEIECRRVTTASDRLAFSEITAIGFEIPFGIATAVYTREKAWHGQYRGYVGIVEGRTVSIVAMVAAAGVIGVYSLATLPAYRGKGYGEALLRQAVARTEAEFGAAPVVLQSTDAGYGLYKRMGFRDAAKFAVYLTR
jgi:GNAT superfamily N-acetyltransferase